MQELRQSTAATVLIGPLVDASDGVTEETGVTAGAADSIGIMKHDGTLAGDISGTTTLTHRTDGYYTATLSASDTGTAGRLVLFLAYESVCLPVRHEYMVLPAASWDAKYADGLNNLSADDVWTEAIADHSGTSGSTAEALDNASGTSPVVTVNLEDRREEQYPRGFSRAGNERDLVAFKSQPGQYDLPIADDNGKPRDLSEQTVLFNVFETSGAVSSWSRTAEIVGAAKNIARVSYSDVDVATAGTFAYSLVIDPSGELLRRGTLEVKNCIKDGV